MPASDLPQNGTAEDSALSFNDGADAIENLLDDSGDPKTPNPVKKVEAKEEADAEEAPEEGVDAEDAETDVDPEADPEQDGPDEVKSGGKFVSNDAKVTLNDGTVTTVEALKRGFMSQQSFTRSTQEVAAERKALADHKTQTAQIAQSLAQQRDFVLQAAQKLLPQPPDKSLLDPNSQSFDPMGYTLRKAEYDEHMQVLNQLNYQQQSERGRMTEEQKEAAGQARVEESQRLVQAIPEFKDRKVYEQFWGDAVTTMAEKYGFTEQEMHDTVDHRFYLAMRDLVKYHKARLQAPKVKQEIEAKPRIIPGGRRMDPKSKISREAQSRGEQLRKTGTFDAGVASLMDLNL
jgi:hypothetical protein